MRRVRLRRLQIRRFFYDNAMSKHKTFAERLSGIIDPCARRTRRLAAREPQVGLELRGEAEVRVLVEVAMPAGSDTVLRLIHDTLQTEEPTPRVLGVGDWSWCKGQRHGTILVDLEGRCPINLLPDRSTETLAAWLRNHLGIELISRHRARAYIKGINQSAPDAIQVADRWHLLRNLRDVLMRVLEQNRASLHAAAAELDDDLELKPVTETAMTAEAINDLLLTKSEQRQKATRERRLARHRNIIAVHGEGMKVRAIARVLGEG